MTGRERETERDDKGEKKEEKKKIGRERESKRTKQATSSRRASVSSISHQGPALSIKKLDGSVWRTRQLN